MSTLFPGVRASSVQKLAAIDLPLDLPFVPEDWPIGAAMLQFPPFTADGRSIRSAGPGRWRRDLSQISGLGFRNVEIPSAWLSLGEMDAAEIANLKAILAELGLSVCATSVVRQSIIDPKAALENLAATHRAIDAAAAVGSPLLCLGLHEPLTQKQRDVLWFWTVPGACSPDDTGDWKTAVARYRELADHAAEVGILISLEMYEGTYLGTADSAVSFLEQIDRPNVGLNPDLGNLVRAQEDIEPWESMAIKTLPFANYWHVKNYARSENPALGHYMTCPTPMASGVIDYRKAISFAVAHGFRGAFLCENYGGDGLTVSATNRRYIQDILASLNRSGREG
jgi:sugar phosphate isomerase/epimerase